MDNASKPSAASVGRRITANIAAANRIADERHYTDAQRAIVVGLMADGWGDFREVERRPSGGILLGELDTRFVALTGSSHDAREAYMVEVWFAGAQTRYRVVAL